MTTLFSKRSFLSAGLALLVFAVPFAVSAEGNPFSVSVSNGTAAVGESGTITVTVSAGEGFKCNDKYPHAIRKLSGDGGVEVPKKVTAASRSEKAITFAIPVKVTEAGEHKVIGIIRFSVCNDTACHIKKVPLSAIMRGN